MMIKVNGTLYNVIAWASKTYPGDGVLKTPEICPVVIAKDKKTKKAHIFRIEEIEELDV